jgi:glucan phosphoethanolaminetransferase (alkaline phosphatase superfamily)
MAIGVTLIIILAIVIFIWVSVEFKRFKHKFFAILLILLIVFAYFSFLAATKGKDIDFGSADGLKTAGKVYFAWLGSAFHNVKVITNNAIKMDWSGNSSEDKNQGGAKETSK